MFIKAFLLSILTVVSFEVVSSQCFINKTVKSPYNDRVYDENGDGVIEYYEMFTETDFHMLESIIHGGVEFEKYCWTNENTGYSFSMIPTTFYEDKDKPVTFQTCRRFSVVVTTPNNRTTSQYKHSGCRNYVTHRWIVN